MSTDRWPAGMLVTFENVPLKPSASVAVALKLSAADLSPPCRRTRILAVSPSLTLTRARSVPTSSTASCGGPSSSAMVSVAEFAIAALTPPSTFVLVGVPIVTVTVSAVASASPLPVAVNVTVASCTMLVACPVNVIVGVAVFAPLIDTPVPDAVTANIGLAEPGSVAPVVLASVSGTTTVSAPRGFSGSLDIRRAVRILIAAEVVVSCSVNVPPPVRFRLTGVESLSRIDTTLFAVSKAPPWNR